MIDAFRAVFSGFFGVRKRSSCEADAKRLTPQAVIVAGVLSAAALVLALLGLVKLVAP